MTDNASISAEDGKQKLFELVVNQDFSVSVDINGCLIIVFLAIVLLLLIARYKYSHNLQAMEIDEAEFGIGDQKIKLKPNLIDSQVAYKIWVELSTRKIGIPVDMDKDVISEVYDSWYKFFDVTRELIKEIPASKLKRIETRNIVKLSIDVLNNGVRPHLTEWQARFRRWYEYELAQDGTRDCAPQEIQRKYPHYAELTGDLLAVNRRLIEYRKAMRRLAMGE